MPPAPKVSLVDVKSRLEQNEGNVTAAADDLGNSRRALYQRIDRHGIDTSSLRSRRPPMVRLLPEQVDQIQRDRLQLQAKLGSGNQQIGVPPGLLQRGLAAMDGWPVGERGSVVAARAGGPHSAGPWLVDPSRAAVVALGLYPSTKEARNANRRRRLRLAPPPERS